MSALEAPSPPACGPAPTRHHTRRLREIHRSAGWPCQDLLEIELLSWGLLACLRDAHGRETLRLTEAGLRAVAGQAVRQRAALDAHEALVQRVAQAMAREGRLVWCGLGLRARVPAAAPAPAEAEAMAGEVAQDPADGRAGEAAWPFADTSSPLPPEPGPAQAQAHAWCMARPDVFSIRQTSVERYVDPVVHEIKVRRADLLADLRQPAKRAAYLDLGSCWYVLGLDGRGRPIAGPNEIPVECGVLQLQPDGGFAVARPAPPRERRGLPFPVWMVLARATPLASPDEGAQLARAPA